MADIFQVGIEYDGGKGIVQAKELGKTIEDAGDKGEKAGRRIAAGMGVGEEAAVRQIKQIQALRTALQQQLQLGESMSAAISRDRQMIQQHSTALEQNTRLERDRAAAAHAAQVAIGEEHAAAIDRDRKMILLHTQALEDNTRRELANAAATRSMALAQAEALEMEKARAASASLSGRAGAAFGSLGIGGALGGLAAVGVGVMGLRKVIDETRESQAATAQLEAAVRSTGGAAGYTADQLGDMANALSSMSGYSDEAISRAQAMLLTFDKIRGETFPGATQAVIDLSRRMGGDLQGAAVQVGKALQDPSQGLTALVKSGVSFSEGQKKVIKDFYDTGHAAQGAAIILKELQKEFGGSAAAYRATLGGALDNMNVQFGNLFEASNKSTTNIVRSIDAIAAALPKLSAALAQMQKPGQWVFDLLGIGTPASAPLGTSFFKTPVLPAAYMASLQNKASKGPVGPDLSAIKDELASRDLELKKQNALNAAYGLSDLVLKKIEIHYKALEELRKNAIGHTTDETKALDARTKAIEKADIRQAVLETGTLQLANSQKRFADLLPGLNKWLLESTASLTKYNAATKAAQDTQAIINARDKGAIAAQVAANEARTKAEIAEDAKRIEAAQKYQQDMANIWRDGTEKILTDGLKSYHDFFEDVFQLFSNLMKRMQQEGKISGLGFKGLQLGSMVLGGGLAGYAAGSQVGSLVGNSGLTAALGGAAAGGVAGAAAGTAVLPGLGTAIGAAAGALAGLVGSLISGSKAAKERKVAEEQLRQSLQLSLAQMRVLAGQATPLSLALAQNADAFKSLRMETEAAYAGRKNQAEREARLRELDALEATRTAQIQEEAAKAAEQAAQDAAQQIREFAQAMADAAAQAAEAARKLNQSSQNSSLLRFYDATGQADLAFALRQAIEIQQAIADGLDALSITMLRQALAAEAGGRQQAKADADAQREQQAQTQILQQQAQSLQQSVSAQQQLVDNTRQTVDALRKYSDSLKLGNLSTLSPVDRYNEAKRQYLAIANAASGGDLTAAGRLPEVANAFLEQSKNMFASTGRYVEDFKQVQTFVGAITDRFGVQLTIEEKMLAALQAQLGALQQQIEAQKATTKAVEANKPSDTTTQPKLPPWMDHYPPWWSLPSDNPSTDPVKKPKLPPDDRAVTHTSPYTGQVFTGTGRLTDSLGNYFDPTRGHWYDFDGNINPWVNQGFAAGGDFRGGVMRVGERGPELLATGPARVHTAQQLNADVVAAVRRLEQKFDRLIESNDRQTRTISQSADAQRERR